MPTFEKQKIRRWRRTVYRLYHEKGFSPAGIQAAMVMSGVFTAGTDPSVLQELTGLSTDYVKKVLRRLRAQRILVGQTLRTAWESDDGWMAEVLDAMVASGELKRGVNKKRSAAQKARAPETRATGPQKKAVKVLPGAVFTPMMKKSDPLYGLSEWDRSNEVKS